MLEKHNEGKDLYTSLDDTEKGNNIDQQEQPTPRNDDQPVPEGEQPTSEGEKQPQSDGMKSSIVHLPS